MKELTEYHFPEDLKTMTPHEMELLACAIREFLINKVSETGGHLASNLGIVELSLALHRVFDSPKDKIIWDVGHQSYVHKILTGRANQFDSLRQFGGLSGFPKSYESAHDVYDTGHSSVSISVAAGMAAARDLKKENYDVIAVIGDGSLTGGLAYEGLNNIGASKSKVIVVLNDNGMSISPNIGGISQHLGKLRTSKGYLGAKRFVKDRVASIPNIGKNIASGLAEFKNDLKYSIMDSGGVLFEELGFTYFGPVDGHDLEALIDVLDRVRNLNEPVLVHVITRKGKGYRNAEKDPGKFHGIGPFDRTTGVLKTRSEKPTFSSLMGKFAVDLAENDPRITAITAAMRDATGLGLFAQRFPERFFDVGIAEEHAITFAAGMAKSGMRPLVAIYSSFLQRGYDQLLEDICLQNLPVVFLVDRAGCVGADGETHHGIFDLSYLRQIPGMTVLTPKDGNQLEAMMKYALLLDGPCAIRYPRGEADYDRQICSVYSGKNIRTLEPAPGSQCIDIWAVGTMHQCGEEVCRLLKEHGYRAGLVDVTCVKPLDLALFREDCKLLVTLEDNTLEGGFGEKMATELASASEHEKHRLVRRTQHSRILRFGWPDAFIEHGSVSQLQQKYGLSPEKITERICEEIEGKA
ncbi:MAG: 1-deoxy-D-xylulose-5-phosphate synthase [Firmicutes bacterium]|nr:1-deoxy-D-xylulose-5-phosphate synthase [Bacillota bacterium]MDD7601970.1 1-deoxy-D-xylulose-5-phosphate synthase [Bacillota bacterium]MDY5855986.1 1-deoxy-D-xylulose-5-phosphate synthase [Anaerovoracaceae bacterium]